MKGILLTLSLLLALHCDGFSSEPLLRKIEKREFRHHPMSSWYYLGSQGDHHILENDVFSAWKLVGSDKLRLPKDLLEIEEPFEYERKSSRSLGVSIAIKSDHIRFSVKGQSPQEVAYQPLYDWALYRSKATYKDYTDKERKKADLWDDLKVYADELKGDVAKGKVFLAIPRKPTKSEPEPGFTYLFGDRATFDREKRKATVTGAVAKRSSKSEKGIAYAMSPDTEFQIKGARWSTDGPIKTRASIAISGSITSESEVERKPLPDLSSYLNLDRPQAELWGGVTVYADELDASRAQGLVYLRSEEMGSESIPFQVFGDRLEFDREEKILMMRGVEVVASPQRVSIGLSPWVEFHHNGKEGSSHLTGPHEVRVDLESIRIP